MKKRLETIKEAIKGFEAALEADPKVYTQTELDDLSFEFQAIKYHLGNINAIVKN